MKIKHYTLPTRKLARLYTNVLKEKGHTTSQPRSKSKVLKGTLTLAKGVKALKNAAESVSQGYLVSTCTKVKKPVAKKMFSVMNEEVVPTQKQAIQA